MALDVIDVIDGLIGHTIADLQAGPDSLLEPVLSSYGLVLDIQVSRDDPGELRALKFGDRSDPPEGLSICFVPVAWEEQWFGAPDGARFDYSVQIRVRWRDQPVAPNDSSVAKLTGTPGRYWRALCALSRALQALYGPASLGAAAGGWQLPNGTLLAPMCDLADPATEEEIRGTVGLVAELEFSGYTLFANP